MSHWTERRRGGLPLPVLLTIAVLGLGLLFAGGLGGLVVLYRAGIDPLTEHGLWSVLWRAIKGVNGWLVVVAILDWQDAHAKSKMDRRPITMRALSRSAANRLFWIVWPSTPAKPNCRSMSCT